MVEQFGDIPHGFSLLQAGIPRLARAAAKLRDAPLIVVAGESATINHSSAESRNRNRQITASTQSWQCTQRGHRRSARISARR
jgi:hypothetical protein